MISFQLDEQTDIVLSHIAAGRNRSQVMRELIQRAGTRQTAPALQGMDLGTAKRASLSLMDLLALVATGLEATDPESAVEMVTILETRLRHWREVRQTEDEQMATALQHVLGVMERIPAKQRAKVMAGAVEQMQEWFT